MKFIIGGAYQGKKKRACELLNLCPSDIIDGTSCNLSDIYSAAAISDFHIYIKRCMENDIDPYDITEKIIHKNPNLVIITNEIGYGIVPVDPFDRTWREKCGRSCCMVAENSELVLRVVAGNVMILKGEI